MVSRFNPHTDGPRKSPVRWFVYGEPGYREGYNQTTPRSDKFMRRSALLHRMVADACPGVRLQQLRFIKHTLAGVEDGDQFILRRGKEEVSMTRVRPAGFFAFMQVFIEARKLSDKK